MPLARTMLVLVVCIGVLGCTAPAEAPALDGAASPRGDDAPAVLQGRPAGVLDGDTIDMADGTRVRLAITDTPEVHGGTEPCGAEASDFTAGFIAGETIVVLRPTEAPSHDRYDRLLGEVVRVTDGASLNVALVRAGLARIDGRFTGEDPDLAARLQAAAKEATLPACAADATDT